MFKKIKDWLGANLDVYKVEKADDVGAGLVRHKWQGEQTATQTGTTLTADILNNFQKGLIPFVETVRTTGTDKDIYTVSVNGLKEFGLFDGLKLLLQIDNENQYNNSVININDSEYPLYSVKNGANETVKKGSLRAKGYYFITYNQNAFYLNTGNVLGTESDTVLEGKRLAEIIGLEYGGDIQDAGTKTTGKFYYDKALKYYYECIVNNSLTYNDGSKFRAISNKPILDKVEKLFGVQKSQVGSIKFAGIEIKWGIVPDGASTLRFPTPFSNACFNVQVTRLGSAVNNTPGSGSPGASTILAIYKTHFDLESVIGSPDKSELTYLAIGY